MTPCNEALEGGRGRDRSILSHFLSLSPGFLLLVNVMQTLMREYAGSSDSKRTNEVTGLL